MRQRVARVGTATAVTALCGYAVIYRRPAAGSQRLLGIRGVRGAFGLVTGVRQRLLPEKCARWGTGRLRAAAVPIHCRVSGWSASARWS